MAPHTVGGPVPVASRVGRDKQRYDGETGGRMVAGTVPVRVIGDDNSNSSDSSTAKLTAENVRVLLVTSRSGAGLVFPKGGWETDESCEAAAARETVEEAGVRGDLEPEPLGTFRFASSKQQQQQQQQSDANGSGAGEGGGEEKQRQEKKRKKSSAATMFALRVREELQEWPESGQRCRVWLSPGDALAACKHAWMREALRVWATRHGIGGGGGEEGEEERAEGGGGGEGSGRAADGAAAAPSPLRPAPGGRERAAAAAIEAAKAAGLAVVPWIRIADEEEEEEGDGGGGGGGGGKGGGQGTKSAAAAGPETK